MVHQKEDYLLSHPTITREYPTVGLGDYDGIKVLES